MIQNDKIDDDIESDTTGLLENKSSTPDQPEIPFCGWLSVKFYQPVNDVESLDWFSSLLSISILTWTQKISVVDYFTPPFFAE